MSATTSLRQRLVDELVDKGAIRSPWLRRAFADIPREVFVPRFHRAHSDEGVIDGAVPDQRAEWLTQVYTDRVLVVQYTLAPEMSGAGAPTSSSSQPTVMAGMLEALDLSPAHRVLEIGTGTGYNTALLCHRVGDVNVTSIELDPGLAGTARGCLASIGLRPRVHAGDGAAGLVEAGPFDRIIATVATTHIPPAWINQLAPGGVIVADLRGGLAGSLLRLTATGADAEVETVEGRFLDLPGAFMPLRARTGSPHRDGESWHDVVYNKCNPHRRTTDVDPATLAVNRSLRFLTQLHLAGLPFARLLFPIPGTDGDDEVDGRATDASWFTANLRPGPDNRYPVMQGGPHRLWDTVETAHASWLWLGEPGVEQFGVTAHDDVDHQFIWYDNPESGYRWPLPL